MKVKYKLFASKMREDLYKSLKMVSVAEDKPIHSLLEHAVEMLLKDRKFSATVSSDHEKTSGIAMLSVELRAPEDRKKKPR